MAEDHVADAAATLLACIDAAEALIASRDQTGTGMITGGASESAPPWNDAAAHAVLAPWAGVRDLENWARELLDLEPLNRGGSAANTREATQALARMAPALPGEAPAQIERKLMAWARLGLALPAVDRLPQWAVIGMAGSPPDCPYCARPSLREHVTAGVIACLYPACPAIRGESRPFAFITVANGVKFWTWLDGTVQPP
jgi:hypothetical protein